VAGALGQRRLVGRVAAGFPERQRVAQHVAPERLGRLRQEDRLPRQRFDDVRPLALRLARVAPRLDDQFTVAALDGVLRGDGRNRRPGFPRGGNRPRDQVAAGKRPRRIVDDHQLALLVDRRKRIRHRVLPPRPARHHANALASGAQVRRRIRGKVRRERHDDLFHGRVLEKRGDTALENRSAADGEELLRHRAADPQAAAARRDDGRNKGHGSNP
jgi:hypothetical protein